MYLIPFLRSYANFLGVDPNQAVTRFLTELQRQDAATVAPPEHRPPVVTPRSGPSRLASWVMPFLFLLVILVIGSYLWQKGHLQTLMSWWQSRAIKEKLVTEPTVGTPPPPASALVPDAPVAVVPTPSTPPESRFFPRRRSTGWWVNASVTNRRAFRPQPPRRQGQLPLFLSLGHRQ
jgi:cytoskeletal protein RodZ